MSSKREIKDYLQDILQSIIDIRDFTAGMTSEQFLADRKTIHAVIRSLEIIGEATKKIPSEIRRQRPDLPWIEIAAMRDKLIHEYFGVDLEIVWETVTHDLAPLEEALRNLLVDLQ
jgi:uncharacterized protein with HEPN domain